MKNLIFMILMSSLVHPAFASGEPKEDIHVSMSEDADGNDILDGGFSISASTDVAWNVLTDYDGMASFVSSIKSSRTLKRETGFEVVEQVMSGKAGFFRKRVHLLLNVTESPPSQISFHDVSKKSFKLYEGTWELTPTKGHIQITYHLKANPDFFSPDFLAVKAFKNTVKILLTEVRAEIKMRSERGHMNRSEVE